MIQFYICRCVIQWTTSERKRVVMNYIYVIVSSSANAKHID